MKVLVEIGNCKPDDILDAACLAVTAALKAHDQCETIPSIPDRDANGLLMQMVVPKQGRKKI